MIRNLAQAAGRPVSRETFEKIERYVALLREENARQNLISPGSMENIWDRHIIDSAQLVRFEQPGASWIDIGSGAGLPGVVIACLGEGRVTLAEPRRLRAEFLHKVSESLELKAEVVCARAERITATFDMITARAVAPLGELLKICAHLSTRKTVWALPKGRNALGELAEVKRTWQGDFRVEPSVTSDDSFVVVATKVRART